MKRYVDIDDAFNIVIDYIKPAIVVKLNDNIDTAQLAEIEATIRLVLDKYIQKELVDHVDVWQ